MTDERFLVAPQDLGLARQLSHTAVQGASMAARANLPAVADDSHSSLRWHEALQALVSEPLSAAPVHQLGFSFSQAALLWIVDGEPLATLALADVELPGAIAWCDERLLTAGLAPASSAVMPYELQPIDFAGVVSDDTRLALRALGGWYECAQRALTALPQSPGLRVLAPQLGPAAVRCWPHHFDLATLFVLEAGNPETARSIGVGLSPGDGSIADPYFYCTPWPVPTKRPEASHPFSWHRDAFTALVCPVSRLRAVDDVAQLLSQTVRLAHAALF